MIRIRLISSDEQLYQLCRQMLAQLPGHSFEFTAAPVPDGAAADLYLWDFHPESALPDRLDFRDELKSIFLLERKDLGALRDRLPLAAVSILLKPVNQAALRTFLEHAIARSRAHQAGTAAREDLLQCLLYANLRLQEYDQERTNFLARALHDFRTPLTAVNGYCGLLLSEQLGSLTPQQEEVLRRMQHSIRRLSRMATGLFQLSAGRQCQSPPRLEPADIRACIDQAVYEVSPLAREKAIDISVRVSAAPRPLYFEPSQIEQVLVNLLENACRFTPRNGFIEVSGYASFWERRTPTVRGGHATQDRRRQARADPNVFRVDVSDSGPGVPPEIADRLFEEYTTYRGSRDRSGGGLGLAICKMIVQAHRGRVWAESGGGGATFSFVLPFPSQDSLFSLPQQPPPAAVPAAG